MNGHKIACTQKLLKTLFTQCNGIYVIASIFSWHNLSGFCLLSFCLLTGLPVLTACATCTLIQLLPPANVVCEGYVFTHVCHSVHRGKGGCAWLLGGVRGCSRGGVHGCSWGSCMVALGGCAWLLLGGMHGCSHGGMCGCSWGGHAWDTMRYRDTGNERAVCILLECILVP